MVFFFSFEQEILVPKDFEAGGSRMIIGAGTFNKVKARITGKNSSLIPVRTKLDHRLRIMIFGKIYFFSLKYN